MSIIANSGEADAGFKFKIYVNNSPINSTEIFNVLDTNPTNYSAFPYSPTFNFIPGTNTATTITLYALQTGGNGWRFAKGFLADKHLVTALVF